MPPMTSPAVDAEQLQRAVSVGTEPSGVVRPEFETDWIAEKLAKDGVEAALAMAMSERADRPDDLPLLADMARLYRLVGHGDQELSTWQRVLGRLPQHSEARARVSLLMFERGDHQGAERGLRGVLDREPNDRACLYALATVYMRQRRYQDALPLWTALAAIDVGSVEPILGRARAYHGLGQYDAARAAYSEARRSHPHNVDVLRGLAALLTSTQNYDDAIAMWRRVAALSREDTDLQLQIALLHSRAEQVTEAMAVAAEILRREPGNFQARRLLGGLYFRTGQFDLALTQLRAALSAVPNDLHALNLLGRTLSRLGKQEGLAIWAKVAELTPAAVDPWLQLGRLAAKLDRPQTAAEAFANVLKRDADHGEARLGLERAKALLQPASAPANPAPAASNPPAAPAAVSTIERLCIEANAKLLDGAFAAAEAFAREAQAVDPAHILPRRMLGYVMVRTGRWEEARDIWSRVAADQGADRAEALFNLARAFHGLGRADDAIASLREARQLKPEHRPTAYLLVRTLVESNRDDQAAVVWDELLIADPEAIEPPLGHARIAMRRGDWASAEQWVDRVLVRVPDHVESLVARAQILAAQLRWKDALEAWQSVLAIDAKSNIAQSGIAQVLLALNRPVEAADAYRRVLAHKADDLMALAGLGRALFQLGEYGDSQEAWSQVLAVDSTSTEASVFLGRIAEHMRQEDEAERFYRNALANSADDRVALTLLGRLLSASQRNAEAAQFWEKLRIAAPDGVESWRRLGQIRESEGQIDTAINLYREAIKRQPHDIPSNLRLAALLHHKQMTDAAVRVLERLTSLRPERPDGWHYLVAMLAASGRSAAAREALAKAQAAIPCEVDTLVALGRAAETAQLTEDAEAIFHKVMDLFSGESRSHEELGRFYLRQGRPLAAYRRLKRAESIGASDAPVGADLKALQDGLKLLGVNADARQMKLEDLQLPEDLFPLVVRMAGQSQAGYKPVARRIAICAASLAPGRVQRQLVRMIDGLTQKQSGLDRIGLFAQSLSERERGTFYLPYLRDKPVEIKDASATPFDALLSRQDVAQFADLIRLFPPGFGHAVAAWIAELVEFRPAVLHGWGNEAGLAGAVAGLLVGVPRIVLSAHGARATDRLRGAARYLESGYRALLTAPNVVLVCDSEAGARDYADWLGFDVDGVRIVHGGVDFRRLVQADMEAQAARHRAALGIPQSAPVVGGVFRLSEEKQPLLWVETAAKLANTNPDIHFVVCGDGPYRSRMRERASELGIADRLHLPLSQRDIGSWYMTMTVLLSTASRLGPSEVMAEAQYLGIPVVALASGGAPEVIEDGVTGHCVADSDVRSLSDQVRACVQDEGWRTACRERARAHAVDRFGVDAMIGRMLAVYALDERSEPAKKPKRRRSAAVLR